MGMIIDSEELGHTTITPKMVRTYLDKISHTKQWLAKITGIDPKFGFKRDFEPKEKKDYRPDFWEMIYPLEKGCLYEYKNFYVALGQYCSGYFAVNEQGTKIISLEYEEVRRYLNMPVKNWDNRENKKTKFKLEEYFPDNAPF